MAEKENLIQFIRKLPVTAIAKAILYILLLTALFGLLAMFPNVGYSGKAHVKSVDPYYAGGSIYVEADVDVTFNPILYPLSWLFGEGHISRPIWSVSVMEHVGHWTINDLEDSVLFSAMLSELIRNFLFLFIMVASIEIVRQRKLHLCLLAGVFGFYFGGFIGAFVGLFIGGFSIFLLLPYLEELGYEWFLEENERAKREGVFD